MRKPLDFAIASSAVLVALACLTGGTARAAVDPALNDLSDKVDDVQNQLDIAKTELDIHILQHEINEPIEVAVVAGLNDARRRDWERLLLTCATAPGHCVIPQMLISNTLNGECVELDEEPDNPEGVFYRCPLKEVYVTVLRDLEAAQKQGLERNFAAAQASLDAAADAIASGDAEAAFWSTCAAFKSLACR